MTDWLHEGNVTTRLCLCLTDRLLLTAWYGPPGPAATACLVWATNYPTYGGVGCRVLQPSL